MAEPTLSRAPVRMRAALIVLLAVGFFLAARLFWWQIVEMDELTRRGIDQTKYYAPILARRGDIVTADATLLATDVFLYTVSATPKDIRNPERVARELAPILGQPYDAVLAKLKSNEQNITLAKNVPQSVGGPAQSLKERLGLGGLKIEGGPKRVYPANSFAEQIVGYVNLMRQSAYGIERRYDDELHGTDGWITGSSNAYRDIIPFNLPASKPAVDGARIVLTLHSGIQRIAEAELLNAVRETRATGGTIIIMDVKTGAILAMASYPTADLNAFYDPANESKYANPAISAQYEPGSVFKIVTVACALEAGTVNVNSIFDDTGFIIIGGRTIRNHDNIAPGRVTLTDVLRMSLNVEAAKMSVGMGAERFYQCLSKFGFGAPTRIDLAAEVTGKVKSVGDGEWREVDLATNSFGQGIAVTPLQMIAAVSAVANQGKLMRPYIVQEIQPANGTARKTNSEVVRQVIRPEIAQTLTKMLSEAIVTESTSKAVVPGYSIAGKTGTAQIPIAGILDPRWTIASFTGYLPADDPRYAILVKIDKPQTSEWGSQVASPVFASVAKQLVSMVGLPPDKLPLASK
ncbi:MAG: penicillin-binding protein 2 [Anaerolineales bacterium]|nr:penicillin-binding protein 2 [Anaerolineales bacterium]